MSKPDAKRTVQRFGPDGWSTMEPHPLGDLLTDGEDWDAGMTRRGWREFSRIGANVVHGDERDAPFHLLVLHRPDAGQAEPRFLIEISGNAAESCEHVAVQDVGSLMTLLDSWAPALQSTAVAHGVGALAN